VVITNAESPSGEVVERKTPPNATAEVRRGLGITYPVEMYSLSHVAVPFPLSDSLYGLQPEPGEHFGVHLGTITARGEVGLLIVGLENLIRASSNPFFPYMLSRIEEGVAGAQPTTPARRSTP
jgi:hypothetical protein